MKKILALLMMAVLIVSCSKKDATPKSEEDKAFYALGGMLGTRFKDLSLNEKELALVTSGLKAAANGQEMKDSVQYQGKIQEIFNTRMKKKSEDVQKKGVDFLNKFVTDGAEKTESGLAYKIEKPGTGKKPKETDTVEVHYHGTLIDGTVFDSSVERGKTVSFPLNRVIKGWTEGLQLIGEGGKVKLVIPSELAYGDHGAPPKIPGGSTLVFDVELFKVSKGEAPQDAPAKKAPAKKK